MTGQTAASESKSESKKKIPLYRRSVTLNVGGAILLVVLFFAFFPEHIAPFDPVEMDLTAIKQGPSRMHFFGTDNFGRDLFSRVVWGTRVDLMVGVLATLVPLLVGGLIGLLAGYCGGWVDVVLMRTLDIFMAFPYLTLVVAIVAVLGPGIDNLYLAIWLVGWKEYARLVRGEVMVVKNAEYVEMARALGFSHARILFRHVLPNVFSSSLVYGASDVVMCMLAGASLGFLGLGVQPPTAEWGVIIADGRQFINEAPWLCFFPGMALVFAGTGFSLLGDGLSDLLRTKGR
ncbi:MAG: ABC transporter permease [Synergistaceae bacterium]|nr:ABC transporter permease [Synergistaceae bacterium]